MQLLQQLFTPIMNGCYRTLGNYGLAIILFTFISKLILLPATLWTYFNSIKMVRIQPDINFLKVHYYGQPDKIAEEQSELFKREGYHPLLSTVPLFLQILILMGVIEVIKAGIQNPDIDMTFGSLNLGLIPSEVGPALLWSPIAAGLSSWLLCIVQNAGNVLQAEQSGMNKYGTLLFSVGLSLYLGWFVSIGVCLYWICSNLFAIAQLYITNAIVRPRRYVDYEKLEQSRKALAGLESVGKKKKHESYFSENRVRERKDYKRFFQVVNKHLVFYSEASGFYKYFRGYIEYLLAHTNITIHYITSDPNDQIFALAQEKPQIRPYYIGENKLITLMMKMDADIVVMTTPDLDNFHLKRSYIRNDIQYIFIQHDMNNHSLLMREGCTDHFDTIFCTGPHQKQEVRETEAVYGLPEKTLVEVGYPLIDDIRSAYAAAQHQQNTQKKILIAPSWQKDNIIDKCLEEILNALQGQDYQIIVRPHPQEVKLKQRYMDELKAKYASAKDIEIQTDFSSNNPIMEADLLITDWSGICWEYAFTTYRPVLFINTPMKVMNPNWQKIPTPPINISLRDKLGKSLELDALDQLPQTVEYLLSHRGDYAQQNKALGDELIYNPGKAAETGAKYIITELQKIIATKGKK